MKNNKSPESDGFHAEFFNFGGNDHVGNTVYLKKD